MKGSRSGQPTSLFVFLALALGYAGLLAYMSTALPERVASHFNAQGVADAYSTRSGALGMAAIIGLALPALIMTVLVCLRWLPPALVNLPQKEYWLAPERREAAMQTLVREGWWLAAMQVAFAIALQILVLRAHQVQPPHLPMGTMGGVTVAFLLGLVFWLKGLYRSFRRPVV